MTFYSFLWTLIIIVAACIIVGSWAGLKESVKGLITVFKRD